MKPFIFKLFLVAILTSVSHAASPLPEGTHFCLPVDPAAVERLRKDSASKAALSNPGEPRTVRMIYYVPEGSTYRQEPIDAMKDAIQKVQAFYAEQILMHGFGLKTMQYETDSQGNPLVHVVSGIGRYSNYWDALAQIQDREGFDFNNNVLFIVSGTDDDVAQRNVLGLGLQLSRNGGWAILTPYIDPNFVSRAAHELGHAFGLWHNFNSSDYVMSYGPGQTEMSQFSAGQLSVHPHFNADSPIRGSASPPVVRLTSRRSYSDGQGSVPLKLEISSSHPLQQISYFVTTREPHFSAGANELKAGRILGGVRNTVVDFVYDGLIPSDRDGVTNLSSLRAHPINIEILDVYGNIGTLGLSLLHESTHRLIIPLDNRPETRNGTYWVAFSPDGKTLAGATEGSTSLSKSVRLWNTETGEHVATLTTDENRGYFDRAWSVAYSPDGTLLAYGSWDGVVSLWDVSTRTEIASFEHGGHDDRIYSLAFSPDGTMLASGSGDGGPTAMPHPIKLWDIAGRNLVGTLRGHQASVYTLAFSPDGGKIASGAFDNTIRL